MAFNTKTTDQLLAELKGLTGPAPQRQALAEKILDEIIFKVCKQRLKDNIDRRRTELLNDISAINVHLRQHEAKNEPLKKQDQPRNNS